MDQTAQNTAEYVKKVVADTETWIPGCSLATSKATLIRACSSWRTGRTPSSDMGSLRASFSLTRPGRLPATAAGGHNRRMRLRPAAGLLTAALACSSPRPASQPQPGPGAVADAAPLDLAAARERLVRESMEKRGITDARVLRAMRRVPREEFVPAEVRARAYEDHPLSIGEGQTISQPYIVAFMTELAALDGHERVLEIGTGSGYQAAVLGELAREVYTIEIVEPLARRAAETLRRLGYRNVEVRHGDGYRGWPEKAPFDVILLTAAPPEVPRPLLEQLAQGGRLIAPVDVPSGDQELVVITRTAHGLERRSVLPVRFVPMTGEARRDGG